MGRVSTQYLANLKSTTLKQKRSNFFKPFRNLIHLTENYLCWEIIGLPETTSDNDVVWAWEEVIRIKTNNLYLKTSTRLMRFLTLNSSTTTKTISNRIKKRGEINKIRGQNGIDLKSYYKRRKQKKGQKEIIVSLKNSNDLK